MRIALVVSRYHSFVTDRLEAGARATLRDAGVADADIETFAVPGRLRDRAGRAAARGVRRVAGGRLLGCLIRGETAHFDYIAQAAAHGIMRAAQSTGVPIAFGVLTTNTAEEALARAGDGPCEQGPRSRAGRARDGRALRTSRRPRH